MGGARVGYLLFLHGFEQGRLRTRRRAIDLVHQHELGEDRAGTEFEARGAAACGRVDFRARDVGRQQVRRALHARPLQPQRRGERLGQVGLAKTGQTFDEHVAPCEHGGDQVGDELTLADDDAVEQRCADPEACDGRRQSRCRRPDRRSSAVARWPSSMLVRRSPRWVSAAWTRWPVEVSPRPLRGPNAALLRHSAAIRRHTWPARSCQPAFRPACAGHALQISSRVSYLAQGARRRSRCDRHGCRRHCGLRQCRRSALPRPCLPSPRRCLTTHS